jgi:hypothetical protein
MRGFLAFRRVLRGLPLFLPGGCAFPAELRRASPLAGCSVERGFCLPGFVLGEFLLFTGGFFSIRDFYIIGRAKRFKIRGFQNIKQKDG